VSAFDRALARGPRSADGGDFSGRNLAHRGWRTLLETGNQGLMAGYLPEAGNEQPLRPVCAPRRTRFRSGRAAILQFHGGVYRSDDAGRSWAEIGAPLPSDFGFPLAVDPADPDSAYVIPLVADLDRVTPEGGCGCMRREMPGRAGRPGRGPSRCRRLPDGAAPGAGSEWPGSAMEMYFGSTTGQVFGSADAGGGCGLWPICCPRSIP